MSPNGFTKTQQAMLNVLADGLPHRREELHACLPDELGSFGNVSRHLTEIRKKIRIHNEDIICVLVKRQICYQHVRVLTDSGYSKT